MKKYLIAYQYTHNGGHGFGNSLLEIEGVNQNNYNTICNALADRRGLLPENVVIINIIEMTPENPEITEISDLAEEVISHMIDSMTEIEAYRNLPNADREILDKEIFNSLSHT